MTDSVPVIARGRRLLACCGSSASSFISLKVATFGNIMGSSKLDDRLSELPFNHHVLHVLLQRTGRGT